MDGSSATPSVGSRVVDRQSVKELFIAGLAAISVLVTSGYAFGAVRRRRALKELLEIRAALEPGDGAWREKVSAMISSELTALEGLGNTTMRWRLAAAGATFSLLALAVLALYSTALLPGQQARDVAHYVAAVSFFASGLTGIALVSRLPIGIRGWRGSAVVVAVTLAVIVATATAATLSVNGTQYVVELTSG